MGDLSKESVKKAIEQQAAASAPQPEDKEAPLKALRSFLRNIAEKTEAVYDPSFTPTHDLPKCKDVVDGTLPAKHQNATHCRR